MSDGKPKLIAISKRTPLPRRRVQAIVGVAEKLLLMPGVHGVEIFVDAYGNLTVQADVPRASWSRFRRLKLPRDAVRINPGVRRIGGYNFCAIEVPLKGQWQGILE